MHKPTRTHFGPVALAMDDEGGRAGVQATGSARCKHVRLGSLPSGQSAELRSREGGEDRLRASVNAADRTSLHSCQRAFVQHDGMTMALPAVGRQLRADGRTGVPTRNQLRPGLDGVALPEINPHRPRVAHLDAIARIADPLCGQAIVMHKRRDSSAHAGQTATTPSPRPSRTAG